MESNYKSMIGLQPSMFNKWYLGKVLEVDKNADDVQVSFMVNSATRSITVSNRMAEYTWRNLG